MHPRYLSLSRVGKLGARALATYLTEVLSRPQIERSPYLRSLLGALLRDGRRSQEVRRRAREVYTDLEHKPESPERSIAALLEQLAHEAEGSHGTPSTLSVEAHDTRYPPTDRDRTLPLVVYAPHLRSPFNVGNIIRSAAAFGVLAVVLGPDCPHLDHPRLLRAAMGAEEYLPIHRGELETACTLLAGPTADPPPIVALETGGTPVPEFAFPDRAVVILGHEELGVSAEHLAHAAESGGIVSIPLGGAKRSLNVGVAFGALLSWWSAKRMLSAVTPHREYFG